MSLINCPNCGEAISDKAEKCVHCGYDMNSKPKHYCIECGAELEEDAKFCAKCGCPVDNCVNKEEFSSESRSSFDIPDTSYIPKKKSKVGIVSAVISIIIIAIIALSFYSDYKANQYYENVNKVFEVHNKCVDPFNESKDLLLSVWLNAIFKKYDSETDKYVCPDGVFSDDFNDALERLYKDKKYQNKISKVENCTSELKALRKELQNPPKGEEEYNELLLDYIDADIKVNTILIKSEGSYQSITDDFNDALDEVSDISLELDTLSD